MRLRKIGLVSAIATVSLAVCLLALAPLGWRLGWWSHTFGFYRVIAPALMLAAVAAVLALATLASEGTKLGLRKVAAPLLVLALSGGIAYLPLQYVYARRHLPAINDIATDTSDRPDFVATLAARASESAQRRRMPEPRLSQMQRAAYPDIAPIRTALPPPAAFAEALAAARSMRRWTIVAVDTGRAHIEASERSRWFGFTDDIVIRVVSHHHGSRIDVRSASRRGSRDFGVNADRVRAYLRVLRKRLGEGAPAASGTQAQPAWSRRRTVAA
jgi:uncharacterized protein (DUF1499 family)